MKPPAFQFYPDDFIGGTVDLSAEQCGGYIRLLCYQWGAGAIPESKEAQDRVAGCSVCDQVLSKFPRGKNKRMEAERRKQAEYRAKQSLKGQASAKARFNRGSTVVQPRAVDVRLQPEGNSPSPSPSPSPSTSTDAQTNNRRPTAEQVKVKCQFAGYPETEGQRFWDHFESSGWIDKNGNPVVSWESKLNIWITDARARGTEAAHHAGTNGSGRSGAKLIVQQKELERVEKRIQDITNSVDGHRELSQEDWNERKKLKVRRDELKAALGIQV